MSLAHTFWMIHSFLPPISHYRIVVCFLLLNLKTLFNQFLPIALGIGFLLVQSIFDLCPDNICFVNFWGLGNFKTVCFVVRIIPFNLCASHRRGGLVFKTVTVLSFQDSYSCRSIYASLFGFWQVKFDSIICILMLIVAAGELLFERRRSLWISAPKHKIKVR